MWKTIKELFSDKNGELAEPVKFGRVVSDGTRCVQCGICGYNCPVGIHVRDYARQGLPVTDSSCIACGNCVNLCPRGTLRWDTDLHNLVAGRFAAKMGRGES